MKFLSGEEFLRCKILCHVQWENPNIKNIYAMETPKYFSLKIEKWPYGDETLWQLYIISNTPIKCNPKINCKVNFALFVNPFEILQLKILWKLQCSYKPFQFQQKNIFQWKIVQMISFLPALAVLTCWRKLWEFLGDNCFNHSASRLVIISSLSRGKSLLTWGVTGNSQVLRALEKSSCLIEFLNIAFLFCLL